ncbi:hypothetical protein NC652_035088 [Populus alba x Populus x berolinensis]|nr:hypothetical protein NC652_035083 [Populus alba x Populus x berolinensis]KAJ6875590.1 hypothetical protein NC652_035088 [Populus alba x Populus x berolinensis]
MLPEGLQFVTTLEQLVLLPLLDEHEERLKPTAMVAFTRLGTFQRKQSPLHQW